MKSKPQCFVAILAMLAVSACSTINETGYTMRGKPAEASPPSRVNTVSAVPESQSTYHYKVDIYPGLDENFDPDPKLTLTEYNQLTQLDWYCARKVGDMEGEMKEMLKQGVTYGGFQGFLGALGAKMAFGSLIQPVDYLIYIGMTGLGGGLGSGKITFEMALNVAHGYCMTGMTYKADELEGKLRRIFIVPVYTGKARLPAVSEKPAPTYKLRSKKDISPFPR